ncbi:MAG: exonuclease domain-containing protein [Bacteroidota bacterium]
MRSPVDTRINDAEFFVVDVETTGLNPRNGDRVVEVGAVKMIGGAIVETFGSLIKVDIPISYGAFICNNISPAMLEDAPYFETVAEKIVAMSAGSFLAAYNAPFDVSFLNAELARCEKKLLHDNVVDVLPLARRMIPNLPRYKHEVVAAALQISFPVKHRALEDTIVTAQILAELCRRAKASGYQTVADLMLPPNTYPEETAPFVEQIFHALTYEKKLLLKYQSGATGTISERIITPKKIERRYLTAYCHTSEEERTFRVDRILELKIHQ